MQSLIINKHQPMEGMLMLQGLQGLLLNLNAVMSSWMALRSKEAVVSSSAKAVSTSHTPCSMKSAETLSDYLVQAPAPALKITAPTVTSAAPSAPVAPQAGMVRLKNGSLVAAHRVRTKLPAPPPPEVLAAKAARLAKHSLVLRNMQAARWVASFGNLRIGDSTSLCFVETAPASGRVIRRWSRSKTSLVASSQRQVRRQLPPLIPEYC
jgi:hypothetical protein